MQRRIEVHTRPSGADFGSRTFHELTATLALQAFPGTARQWLPPDSLHDVLEHQERTATDADR